MIAMLKLRLFAAAALCGGGLFLCGCHHEQTGPVPIPPPGTAAPVQAQMRDVDSNPHIPDAQKAAIKASIAAHAPGGGGANPKPGP